MAEPIGNRRFTDREVREILKRAVEDGPTRTVAARGGISLAELKSIGKEVGIDPSRLDDAARAVLQNENPSSNPIIGAPTNLRHKETVNAPLDPTRNAELLSAIRRVMGLPGDVSEISGSLEWRTKGGSVERLVSVFSQGGTTTIEAFANLRQMAVGSVALGISALVFFLVGVTLSIEETTLNLAGVALSGGFLAAVCWGLRRRVRRASRSESEKLEHVVSELALLIRQGDSISTDEDVST